MHVLPRRLYQACRVVAWNPTLYFALSKIPHRNFRLAACLFRPVFLALDTCGACTFQSERHRISFYYYNRRLGTVENHENTEAVFFVFFVSCRVFRVFLQLPCFAVFLQFCWPFNSFAQFLNNKLIIVFLFCYLRLLSLHTGQCTSASEFHGQ